MIYYRSISPIDYVANISLSPVINWFEKNTRNQISNKMTFFVLNG